MYFDIFCLVLSKLRKIYKDRFADKLKSSKWGNQYNLKLFLRPFYDKISTVE